MRWFGSFERYHHQHCSSCCTRRHSDETEEETAEERSDRQLNPPRRLHSLSISSNSRRKKDNQVGLVCCFTDVLSLSVFLDWLLSIMDWSWTTFVAGFFKTERKLASPENHIFIKHYLSLSLCVYFLFSRFRLFPHLQTPPIRARVDKRWKRRSSNKDKHSQHLPIEERRNATVFIYLSPIGSSQFSFHWSDGENAEINRTRSSDNDANESSMTCATSFSCVSTIRRFHALDFQVL